MKLSHFGIAGLAMLAMSAGLALADDANMDNGVSAVNTTDTLKNSPKAKMSVAPHGIMVESSLMSSKARVEGLKSQLQLAEDQKPGAVFVEHARIYSKDIGTDVSTAVKHEAELKGSLSKYPSIANKDQTKKMDTAVTDLDHFYKSWEAKAKTAGYWQNTTDAKADLDILAKRIDDAIDQSKSFNSDQFSVSIG